MVYESTPYSIFFIPPKHISCWAKNSFSTTIQHTSFLLKTLRLAWAPYTKIKNGNSEKTSIPFKNRWQRRDRYGGPSHHADAALRHCISKRQVKRLHVGVPMSCWGTCKLTHLMHDKGVPHTCQPCFFYENRERCVCGTQWRHRHIAMQKRAPSTRAIRWSEKIVQGWSGRSSTAHAWLCHVMCKICRMYNTEQLIVLESLSTWILASPWVLAYLNLCILVSLSPWAMVE